MNAIFKRTSIRDYTDKAISEKKIKKLLRAAMAAPSAGNQQPWEFVVVTDPALLQKLTETSPYAKPTGRAPLAIVPLMRQEALRFPSYCAQDMGACVENILLQATRMELGSVWQGIFPQEERIAAVRDVLNIPETLTPFAIIAIGYPKDKLPAQQNRFDKARVHMNAFLADLADATE